MTKLLMRMRLPQTVYAVALTGALIIGAFLPNLQSLWLRRVETVTVPRLLKQIYEAEMTYSARQPDGNFICDGTLLPGAAGKLGWNKGNSSIQNYLVVDFYTISLDRPDEVNPRSFQLTADSNEGYIPAPTLVYGHGRKVDRQASLSQLTATSLLTLWNSVQDLPVRFGEWRWVTFVPWCN